MSFTHKEQQNSEEGYGPLYHRIYSVPISGNIDLALKMMQQLQVCINEFSPQVLARFEKVKGDAEHLKAGDEFMIHITGPWNGPVRVAEVSGNGFRLQTLQGHLEAGEIRLSLQQSDLNGSLRFEIESLARSRDAIVDFVYDKVPIARFSQTEMWTYFCREFANRIGKQTNSKTVDASEISVLTERQDEETGQWQKV